MPFDPGVLLNLPPIETRQHITPFKVILYALSLGAEELTFVYEQGLRPLPTMAVALTYPGFVWRDPALSINWRKILHADTSLTLHANLPVDGELIGRTRFGPIFDKGTEKGTMVVHTREIYDAQGNLIATVRNTNYLRGDGGHGGSSVAQSAPHVVPESSPDATLPLTTRHDQALLYRLASDDMNPLHADPNAARAAGFDRPILHGLATYGVAGRALLRLLTANDPERIRRIDARFSAPVYPGETIETSVWHDGLRRASFRCRAIERDAIVLDNGYVEFT